MMVMCVCLCGLNRIKFRDTVPFHEIIFHHTILLNMNWRISKRAAIQPPMNDQIIL